MRNLAIAATVWVLSSFGAQSQSITNYAFSASSGSFSQITGTAMTGMGTGTVDEGYYSSVPIGFDFFYMGVRYTSLSVSTNGWLTLGTNITNATPINNLATGGSPRPVIAPLWDDLNLQTTANSSFATTGTVGSRIFTLQILNNKWSAGAPGTTISYQVKLYESNGRIQFVYRPEADAINAASASIGISATGTGSGTFLSLNNTGTTPTVSSTAETNNVNSKPASGQTYSFLSPTPTAPTSLSFATVSTTGYTLNWLDNSANETGFAVYVSTDGSNFSYVTKTVANAASSVQTGLTAGTLYYWRVFAVTEGALSTCASVPKWYHAFAAYRNNTGKLLPECSGNAPNSYRIKPCVDARTLGAHAPYYSGRYHSLYRYADSECCYKCPGHYQCSGKGNTGCNHQLCGNSFL